MTPPLCFVPMADPKLAQDAKRRLAERLFSMSDDELPDCMQRVRLLSGSVDAIMGDFWQSFLFHQWNKLPLTTQFLECLFAAFKNWRLRVPHAMTTALLAAKHTCHEFQRACSRKRNFNAMLGEPGARTKQARPKWIMKRGDHGRWNRFHMHVRECIRARPCGQSARAAFASAAASYDPRAPGPIMQAQVANTLQKQRKRDAMQQVLPERCGDKSVWDLGDDAYPLKASFMEFANRSHTSRMEHTERWKAHNVKRDPDPDFPDSVYHQHVLSADQAAMSTEERKTVQSIVDELGIVFANRSQKVHRTSPVLVTMASGHNVLVTCCSCSKNYPFTGDFFEHERMLPSGEWKTWAVEPFVVPVSARLPSEPLVPEGPMLAPCLDEKTLAARIHKLSPGQRVYQPVTLARLAPHQNLFDLTVTEVHDALDLAALQQEVRQHQLALRATRLFKQAQQPHFAKKRQPKLRRNGGRQGGHRKADADGGCSSASEEEVPQGKKSVECTVSASGSDNCPGDFEDLLKAETQKAICEARRSQSSAEGDAQPMAEGSKNTGPRELAPAPPPTVALDRATAASSGGGRRQKLDQFDIDVYGLIKIDRKLKSLNAHCGCQGPAPYPDHRYGHALMPCRMNRVASKRSLGLLVAWLRKAAHPFVMDRSTHVAQVAAITKHERDESREWLQTQPHLAELLAFEAEVCGVEVVDEPESIS